MIGRFCDYAINNLNSLATKGMSNNELFFTPNSAIVSTSSELFLHFETDQDSYFQEKGFEFQYSLFGKSIKEKGIGNAGKYILIYKVKDGS